MKKVTVIAIDRAEYEAGKACKKLAENLNIEIQAYMLVNTEFKKSPAYRGDENQGYFTEIVCDFSNPKQLKKTLKQLKANKAIFHCRMEEAIKDFARVVSLLSNKYVQSPQSLLDSTVKFSMRRKISKRYPEICPKFVEIRSRRQLSNYILKDFKYPLIVKPNGLHSSFFVAKCNNFKELEKCISSTFHGLKKVYEREYGTGQPSVIIEEFIEGEMYSIDVYVNHKQKVYYLPPIRVVTAAEQGLDGYYSYRHIIPTELTPDEVDAANLCTRNVVKALGLKSSTAHVELYKTEEGWKIIELGPRIGGYRQDLYREAFGIDHYYNDLLIHFGRKPEIKPAWHRHAAGLNIYADTEGKITSIKGLEDARKLSSVIYLDVNLQVGEHAKFASKGGQFVVDGILSNDDKDKLEADVTKVRQLIKIKTS